jgi:hypothetical protein
MFSGVNTKLAATAARRGGWFDRRDAIEAGYSDVEIRARVREGRWTRLCRGAYAALDPEEGDLPSWERAIRRHVRTAKAVYHRLGGRAVLSHQSALLVHGVEISDVDLSCVHVTRLSGCGRPGESVRQHASRPPVTDPVEVDGVHLTPAARSVVETIRYTSYAIAVSVVDLALRQGVATAAQLSQALSLFAGRTGIRTATRAVEFGDGLAESVGESRLRVLLADLGLPAPVLQAEIRDATGSFVARVDFLLARWGVIIEFDGAEKYRGEDGSQAVVAEKWREDRLRDLGYEVVRVSWADLDDPVLVIRRIRLAIERSQRRAAN